MKAGRELDALIGEKIFGEVWKDHPDGYKYHAYIPYYSTHISDAWLVVGKLREKGLTTHISVCQDGSIVSVDEPISGMVLAEKESESAPLAICLAALKACGVEVEG